MKYLIISFITVFVACSICKKARQDGDNFFVTFGSCFRGASYNIKVNELALGEVILESDFSLGIVRNCAIEYKNQMLTLLIDGAIKSKEEMQIGRNIHIVISGKKTFDGVVDLKKGRYLIIDACTDSAKLVINQYKRVPTIE